MNMPGARLRGNTAAKTGNTPATSGPDLTVSARVDPTNDGKAAVAVPVLPVRVNCPAVDGTKSPYAIRFPRTPSWFCPAVADCNVITWFVASRHSTIKPRRAVRNIFSPGD